MRELSIEDRSSIERAYSDLKVKTFYHYFPLLYSISASSDKPFVVERRRGYPYVWTDSASVFYQPPAGDTPPNPCGKVWIAANEPRLPGWIGEIYDINFIYDLNVTVSVKNFRDNVKKFERKYPDAEYREASPIEAISVVRNWYLTRKSDTLKYHDFGYTLWLAENFRKFSDLKGRVISIRNAPLAFSLWGVLDRKNGFAIHLVCKDRGYPYLQDYVRHRTYGEMLESGFRFVNDGSDVGLYGLRVYKLKLRPWLIIPVWSWNKTFGGGRIAGL